MNQKVEETGDALPSEAGLTVYIVDDEAGIRDALQTLFEGEGMPVQAFESKRDFLDSCDASFRGCLLLDLYLSDGKGLEVMRELLERGVRLPTMILTGRGSVSTTVDAMRMGAVDVLQKPIDADLVVDKVRAVLRRQLAEPSEVDLFQARKATLTAREREVLEHLVEGKAGKEIAAELEISYRTLEKHRAQVMHKTHADSIADLVRMALLCDRVVPGN